MIAAGFCGLRALGSGDIRELGGEFVSINLVCIDDLDPTVLAEAKRTCCNGRDNDWWHVPQGTRHLQGGAAGGSPGVRARSGPTGLGRRKHTQFYCLRCV